MEFAGFPESLQKVVAVWDRTLLNLSLLWREFGRELERPVARIAYVTALHGENLPTSVWLFAWSKERWRQAGEFGGGLKADYEQQLPDSVLTFILSDPPPNVLLDVVLELPECPEWLHDLAALIDWSQST